MLTFWGNNQLLTFNYQLFTINYQLLTLDSFPVP